MLCHASVVDFMRMFTSTCTAIETRKLWMAFQGLLQQGQKLWSYTIFAAKKNVLLLCCYKIAENKQENNWLGLRKEWGLEQETKVYPRFLIIFVFVFLPASSLIIWVMKSQKNFEKYDRWFSSEVSKLTFVFYP